METVTDIPQAADIPETEAQDQYVLSPEEQSELLAGHPWSRFVVMGDSIAVGMGDESEGYLSITWGERVAAALAREREGVSYANLARHRAKAAEIRDEQLARVLELKPDLVAMLGGGNDCFVDEFDIAPVRAALNDVVAALTESGATVVTFETLDVPSAYPNPAFEAFYDRLRALYAATREIADEHGTLHADCYRQPWSADLSCFSEDLQHPTMRAQALAASQVMRVLGEHLRENGR